MTEEEKEKYRELLRNGICYFPNEPCNIPAWYPSKQQAENPYQIEFAFSLSNKKYKGIALMNTISSICMVDEGYARKHFHLLIEKAKPLQGYEHKKLPKNVIGLLLDYGDEHVHTEFYLCKNLGCRFKIGFSQLNRMGYKFSNYAPALMSDTTDEGLDKILRRTGNLLI